MPDLGWSNLYSLLQHIRQRPFMFVREKALPEVETLCRGYAMALGSHGIKEFGTDFHKGLSDYLLGRVGRSMSRGWALGIREHYRNDEEAFERFLSFLTSSGTRG